MQLGVGIPQMYAPGTTTIEPRRISRYLQRAEELGFPSAWTAENIIGGSPSLDPLELMSFAAACTERIDLGCAVLLTPVRDPVHLAKSLATLDQLSQGRLIVGVGLGSPRFDAAYGIDSHTRVGRFTEGLDLMKRLWTQPSVTVEGRFWQLHEAQMEPKPVQQPYPRLWLGGSAPAAVRRAVKVADGFIGAGGSSTSDFANQVTLIKRALAEAGRDPNQFPIAKRVYIAVDNDRERAEQQLKERFPPYAKVAAWGTPEECAQKIKEVHEAGAELVVLSPWFDFDEHLERIAGEIAPLLRD